MNTITFRPFFKNLNIKQTSLKFVIPFLLILLTLFVYKGIYHYEFVNYDDPSYVSENFYIQDGLSLKNIVWAFTNFSNSNWHPLTWLSHMLDIELFGMNAGCHHLTNLFIHVCNTLLLYWLFYLSTGAIFKSAVLAAFFALHPLHVESVAWIAERKDLLCGFFWLLAMVAYCRYAQKPSFDIYLASFVFFIFGALSKPMIVTFPFVLLLFDYWPLKRHQNYDEAFPHHTPQKTWKELIVEKIPMFFVAAGVSYIALISQSKGGSVAELPVMVRVANALTSYLVYLKKLIWPGDLAVIYPLQTPSLWFAALSFFTIICMLIFAFKIRYKHPFFLIGFLWFFGTLVPVIGIIQVGSQAFADRYTYIPSIGFFAAIVWGAVALFNQLPSKDSFKTILLSIITITALTLMILLSSSQVRYWQNSITLMSNAVQVTKNNYIAHENLGLALVELGLQDEALFHFNKVITINPDYAPAYLNIGSYYLLHKEYIKAASLYHKAITLNPDFVRAYALMGKALTGLGAHEEAAMYFEKVRQSGSGEESLSVLRKFEQSEN